VTDAATRMDEVVRAVHPLLREHGFKKERHAFARDLDNQITHAFQFVMGRHEPHPDRQPGLYGAFTAEVGVYVDAVDELVGKPKPRFVRPYDCHFRERLGMLIDGDDTWWTLDQPIDQLAGGMQELVSEIVLPWLERLTAIDDILTAWHARKLPTIFVADVNVALLHYARGEQDVAADMIRTELRRTDHRRAAERLVALAQHLGLDVSMEDAKVINLLEAERSEWTRSDT
jgi:hypothetical protein